MQSWSAMPVIDLTGRTLHYLYSSWLSVTPYVLQTRLINLAIFLFGACPVTMEQMNRY